MARAERVEGQVSVTEVIDEFYEDFATEETGRYWWWPQVVLLDPDELIVNDGMDNLFRIPFTIGGADEGEAGEVGVTFGEPTPVVIEYRDVPAAARAEAIAAACTGIAAVREPEQVAARYYSRAETRPDRKEGGSGVDYTLLRQILDLSADTPDDEVARIATERLQASVQDETDGEGLDTPAPVTQQDDDEGQGSGAESQPATPAHASAASGTRTIDESTLEQLRSDAAAGAAARAEQLQAETNRLLTEAVASGKFPPARRAHWAALLERDREGTIEIINELAENVIPVELRAINAEGDEGQGSGSAEAYPPGWLPEVQARKARMAAQEAAGQRPRVVRVD
jgi:hypothetical protein